MSTIKRTLISNIKNIGKRVTNRKLIVFESDDWGSNRIASAGDYQKLITSGILSNKVSHYDKNDTIARADDLNFLFETLTAVQDKNGNHAVFSPFVNPANPDFDKIRANGFESYFYEPFTTTLDKTGEKTEVLDLWKQGISAGIFIPAFHGREHLCVPLWMKYLQDKNGIVRKAFGYRFYAVPENSLPAGTNAFRPALYFYENNQVESIRQSLIDGINLMNDIFGQQPKVFCPPNGISHSLFDEVTASHGIKSVMTNRFRSEPDGEGGLRSKFYRYGSKNEWGQRYYYRNCCFEPTYSPNAIDLCLLQIEAAFRWGKPAVISSHRVNYIGTLNPGNREEGLKQLRNLLKQIVRRWPAAEFISSDNFSDILHKNS